MTPGVRALGARRRRALCTLVLLVAVVVACDAEGAPGRATISQEVRLDGAGVALAGTVTAPAERGRRPAVVLISGSGAQDRDSSGAGHRPFRVLAEALSASGVVVLRTDDRGVGGSGGSSDTATYDDLTDDALAAVRWLADRPDVDPGRIGLLAHSEGGFVAPRAVARGAPGEIGHVALLHSPAVTGHRTLIEQTGSTVAASGASPAEVDRAVVAARAIADMLRTEGSGEVVDLLRHEAALLGVPPDQAEAALPALRRFVRHDPGPELRALDVPVLALFGEADLMVPAAGNATAAHEALAGNPAATIRTLPGINHVLQPATSGLPEEYSRVETTVDPAVLAVVVSWVTR